MHLGIGSGSLWSCSATKKQVLGQLGLHETLSLRGLGTGKTDKHRVLCEVGISVKRKVFWIVSICFSYGFCCCEETP